jgi:hypothetical protein
LRREPGQRRLHAQPPIRRCLARRLAVRVRCRHSPSARRLPERRRGPANIRNGRGHRRGHR